MRVDFLHHKDYKTIVTIVVYIIDSIPFHLDSQLRAHRSFRGKTLLIVDLLHFFFVKFCDSRLRCGKRFVWFSGSRFIVTHRFSPRFHMSRMSLSNSQIVPVISHHCLQNFSTLAFCAFTSVSDRCVFLSRLIQFFHSKKTFRRHGTYILQQAFDNSGRFGWGYAPVLAFEIRFLCIRRRIPVTSVVVVPAFSLLGLLNNSAIILWGLP